MAYYVQLVLWLWLVIFPGVIALSSLGRKEGPQQEADWNGRRRRSPPRRRSAPPGVTINFGRTKHETAWGQNFRPEEVKSLECDGDDCSACANPSDCWHGDNDMDSLVLNTGSSHTRFLAEVWAQCIDGGSANWGVLVMSVLQGVVKVYIDDDEVQYTSMSETMFPINKDSRIRVEFTRTGNGNAYAVVRLKAHNVDESVDTCMSTKNCLKEIGDVNQAASFELRNSNDMQSKCLRGELSSSKCTAWRNCLQNVPGGYTDFANALSAAVEPVTSMLVEDSSETVAKDDSHCVDPSTADPESWECECLQKMKDNCLAQNRAVDADCFRDLYCKDDRVCCSWKSTHCESGDRCSSSMIARSVRIAVDSQGGSALMRHKSKPRSLHNLDDALSGKVCA